MNTDEFSPYRYFNHLISLWWLVLLATVMGGTLGFIFSQFHRPVYEATATFLVTIDLNRFPLQSTREDLIQYNEDMAVNNTEGALLSTETLDEVLIQLKSTGKSIIAIDLLQNSTIERKHDIWELRYRNTSPQDAQTIVNSWATVGYQTMQAWQTAGKVPDYVIFQPPTKAQIPQHPVLYGRNNLMLAGILIGFIIGIIFSSLVSRPYKNPPQE